MKTVCVRAATTVDSNNKEAILSESKNMIEEVIKRNNIAQEDIISIVFTSTKDLDKVYPAVSAREIGINSAALICLQEMYVENSLEKCLRLAVYFNSDQKQSELKHVYLNKAKALRPDLKD